MVGTDALKKTRKDDDRSKKSKEEVRVSPVLSVLREGISRLDTSRTPAFGQPLDSRVIHSGFFYVAHFSKPVAMFGLSEEHPVWFLLTD